MTQKMLTTGQLAELAHVSKKTLRIYDEKGLLCPAVIDRSNGYRYYKRSQVLKLVEILKLRDLGLSLEMISHILDNDDPFIQIEFLSKRLEDLDMEMKRMNEIRMLLEDRIANYRSFLNPPTLDHCYVEYLPQRIYMGFDIEPFDAIEDNGDRWMGILDNIRDYASASNRTREYYRNISATLNYNALMEERRIEYEKAIIVSNDPELDDGVHFLPSGRYACRYDIRYMSNGIAIRNSVEALLSFVERERYKPAGLYFQEITGEMLAPGTDRYLYIIREQILLESEE